jgi:hypothetical protein
LIRDLEMGEEKKRDVDLKSVTIAALWWAGCGWPAQRAASGSCVA